MLDNETTDSTVEISGAVVIILSIELRVTEAPKEVNDKTEDSGANEDKADVETGSMKELEAAADAEAEKKLSIALDSEADDSAMADEDNATALDLASISDVKDAYDEAAMELATDSELREAYEELIAEHSVPTVIVIGSQLAGRSLLSRRFWLTTARRPFRKG